MPQQLYCHGHSGPFPHQRGADLHCSKECEKQYAAARLMFKEALRQAGFVQIHDPSNLWFRDGVHISIEEVMREGLDSTLARHRTAVIERSAG